MVVDEYVILMVGPLKKNKINPFGFKSANYYLTVSPQKFDGLVSFIYFVGYESILAGFSAMQLLSYNFFMS